MGAGKEMSKDWNYIKMKFANIIDNSTVIPLFHLCQSINNTAYALVGGCIISLIDIKLEKCDVVHFHGFSGSIGVSGMTARLWDRTNGVEIGTISWVSGEDDTRKETDVKSYFQGISRDEIAIECYIKKDAAAGAASELCGANLEFHGLKI